MEFNKLLKFFEFLHKATTVQRTVKLQGRDALENNAEHSFQLALLCWYLIDDFKLSLDKQLVFEYALVHDLVETYAGDTDPYIHSEKFIASKKKREYEALVKIKEQFPIFAALGQRIEQYEQKQDPEAKFVYLIDKITPDINIYLAKDTYYKDNNIPLEKELDWLNSKEDEADFDSLELKQLFETLKNFLKEHQAEIFPT